MNIIYLNHYAGSETLGMEFRPYYISRELQKLGHRVLVIAGDFSHLRKHNPTITQDYEIQDIEGVSYMFLRTGTYQGNGIQRVQSMLRYVLKIIRGKRTILRYLTPDAVICSSTYPLDTYAGRALAKAAGARLYHEIHDLWPLSPMELGGYGKHHPFILLMQQAENAAYKHSDKIISILPNIEGHVRGLGFDTPIVHVPNGLPASYFQSPSPAHPSVVATVEQLKKTHRHVIAYAGGLSVSNAMMDFVRSFEYLQNYSIAGVIIGSGIERETLRQEATEKGYPIVFLDPIPKENIIGSLKQCDSLYVGSNQNKLYQYGLAMNKLFDYLMAGRPVVAAVAGSHSPIHSLGLAVLAQPENPRDIARGIIEASQLPDEQLQQIAERSPAFVKEYHNYENLARHFAEALED